MTTENDTPESGAEEQKSFFARGALLGLIGGALVAVMLISVAGSVVSMFDELFGSSTAAAADDEPVVVDPVVLAGEAVASSNGCTSCHSTDGVDGVGPSWQGLGERADADYILTSIVNPNAVVVDGFTEGVMQSDYGDIISAEDLDALVAYLASL